MAAALRSRGCGVEPGAKGKSVVSALQTARLVGKVVSIERKGAKF
jgi:phage terminase large subunit-like protein